MHSHLFSFGQTRCDTDHITFNAKAFLVKLQFMFLNYSFMVNCLGNFGLVSTPCFSSLVTIYKKPKTPANIFRKIMLFPTLLPKHTNHR